MAVEPDGVEQYAEPAEAAASFRPVFPLRRGKIQRPLLPDDTLRRDRLLDWMASKIRCRIIYIVAEAGFCKTTLVADFARRSRIRTFWYRLDEDDTDGLVFLRYLVASCRSVEPRLLTRTAALLEEPSIEPVNLESALGTFLSEFEHLGDMPSMVVLDDYYLAEHVTSIRSTLERLIARAPNNLAFVFATRRTPDLSVAVLRARSGLAEMGKEELRFEPEETGQFFAQSYHHPLEADVLQDVQARTDGWAASLQLVKTAVEGRTPAQIRAFVRSMSGAEGHLYDYLAQEVVGELAADLRHFLLRAALLDEVETETSAAIAQIPDLVARRLIGEAQHLGLLSRSDGAGGSWRPHPLVREFLLARLETEVGTAGVLELHRRAATLFEPISWRLAARHWAAAGEAAEVRRVLSAAVPTIISTGDLGAAEDLMNAFPDPSSNPWYDILAVLALMNAAKYADARRALSGLEATCQTPDDLLVVWAQCCVHAGAELQDSQLCDRGCQVLLEKGDPEQVSIARASQAMERSIRDGSLDALCSLLTASARLSRANGHRRFEGISLVNLAETEAARGNHDAAVAAGRAAAQVLLTAAADLDVDAARMTTARSLMHLGHLGAARSLMREALLSEQNRADPAWICDAAEIEALYGELDPDQIELLDQLASENPVRGGSRSRIVGARAALHFGDVGKARSLLAGITEDGRQPAFHANFLSLHLETLSHETVDRQSLEVEFDKAQALAYRQQAWFWWKTLSLMRCLVLDEPGVGVYVDALDPTDRAYLSVLSHMLVPKLNDLQPLGWQLVREEASSRPERWRRPLRAFLTSSRLRDPSVERAAVLLGEIGTSEDVGLLRRVARAPGEIADAARGLSRRLAPRAYVEDLGRLSIRVGDRVVLGADVRKKVLSLLGYLLTRPQYSATREQIQEALWPELDPGAAANSLNQTAYFLRRVFEPRYDEKTTAGYLVAKADLIWLDQHLVGSRSTDCLRLLAELRRDCQPMTVALLASTYTSRFATDFLYDDWSTCFRDSLHAAFMDRVERSIAEDIRLGMYDRAISLAQQALMADPDADQIELLLLRLYRSTGAHGAALEQYTHFASVMKEQLGVEPPPLEAL